LLRFRGHTRKHHTR